MGVKYLRRADGGAGVPYGPPQTLAPWNQSTLYSQIDAPAAETDTSAASGISDLILQYMQQQGLNSGSSSSQGTSFSQQGVLPPMLELLMEMRERRNSEAARGNIISDILGRNTPKGQKNYLGFEPGGVADVLMGIITGEGPSAGARILPADQRAVRRQEIPIPGAEPSVGAEAGEAGSLAQQILNAIRIISTGGSQQSSGSQQNSSPAPAGDTGLGAGINNALKGIGG